MAKAQITFPENLEHDDNTKALIDYGQIRGTHWYAISTLDRDAIPVDKRVLGMLVTVGSGVDNVTYRYDGNSVVDPNWQNVGNWTVIGGGGGGGDMLKSVYDTDDSGVVDNSELFLGQDSTYYASQKALEDTAAAIRFDFPDISGLATQSALEDTAAAIRADIPTGSGATQSFEYKFDNNTSSGNPGSGFFRINNSNYALATEIYISDEAENGTNITSLLDALDGNDAIFSFQNDNSQNYLLADVADNSTDNGTWFTIPINPQSFGSNFNDGSECSFSLLYAVTVPSVVDTANVGRNAGTTGKDINADTTIFQPEHLNLSSYFVNTNGGAISVTLPPLNTTSKTDFATVIKFIQVGDGTTTVSASGSETIGGQNKQVIINNNTGFTVQARSDTEWIIVQDSRGGSGIAKNLYLLPSQIDIGGTLYYELTEDRDSVFNTTKTAIFNATINPGPDLMVRAVSDSGFTVGENPGGIGKFKLRADVTSAANDIASYYLVIKKLSLGGATEIINDTTITTQILFGENFYELDVFIFPYVSVLSDRFIFEIWGEEINSNPETVVYAGSSLTSSYEREIQPSNIVITPTPGGNPFNTQYNNNGETDGDENVNHYPDSLDITKLAVANNIKTRGYVEFSDGQQTTAFTGNANTLQGQDSSYFASQKALNDTAVSIRADFPTFSESQVLDSLRIIDSLTVEGKFKYQKSIKGNTVVETFSASKTFDYSDKHSIDMPVTGNTTITISNVNDASYPSATLRIDATGGYSITISGATKWSSTTDIDNTANAINKLSFDVINGTIYYYVTVHNP